MATGDAAAAAGLAVVSSGASLNQGYNDINKKGDELAAVMTRATSLENRTAGRVRGWRYTRATGSGFDTFTSASGFAGLFAGTVLSAPSGDYQVSCQMSLQAPTGAVAGTIRLSGGTGSWDARHDVGNLAQVVTVTQNFYFAGGTLNVAAAMQVSTGGTNPPTNVQIYNASSVLNLIYLGPRV